MYSFLLN